MKMNALVILLVVIAQIMSPVVVDAEQLNKTPLIPGYVLTYCRSAEEVVVKTMIWNALPARGARFQLNVYAYNKGEGVGVAVRSTTVRFPRHVLIATLHVPPGTVVKWTARVEDGPVFNLTSYFAQIGEFSCQYPT